MEESIQSPLQNNQNQEQNKILNQMKEEFKNIVEQDPQPKLNGSGGGGVQSAQSLSTICSQQNQNNQKKVNIADKSVQNQHEEQVQKQPEQPKQKQQKIQPNIQVPIAQLQTSNNNSVPQSPKQNIPLVDQQQQYQQEQRKTVTNSQEFHPFLRESLLDKLIIESIDKEMPCESENGGDYLFIDAQQQANGKEFGQQDRDNMFSMKKIFNEEDEIIKRFSELAKENYSSQKLFDIFEAFIFEIGMRNQEKSNLLDKMLKHDDKQCKLLKNLENRVRRQEKEIQQLRKVSEIKNLRQSGRFKLFPTHLQQLNDQQQFDSSSMYDWIVDIDLITNICNDGWTVTLSEKFHQDHKQLFSLKSTETQIPVSEDMSFDGEFTMPSGNKPLLGESGWNGATVAVVGLYDKGKTYVLNNLTQSNLPSGKKINTKGISFKHVNMDSGTNLILLDTAGWYSPVKIQSELSIVEKEATEMFILDLVFEISDYFICVVNDFTSLDQRYLDKLSRNLQNSPNKTFREIIVIHNLKEVESQEILDHVWENQVTQIYQTGGVIQKTQVAAFVPHSTQLLEKHVVWFKTQYTRHICLVNDDCDLGQSLNPWVFSLLRYWLKAVFVPINRPFSVVDAIMNYSAMKLSSYFKTGLSLHLHDTNNYLIKKIKTKAQMKEIIRLPQVSIDSSGLIMTRPDSFIPAVDIIANEKYQIYMDVPGMSKEDILLYRQNIITVVKGTKKKPYSEYKKLEKNERKYGDFTLSFKIPEIYERKWKQYEVENGVLNIVYEKDVDDIHEIVDNKKDPPIKKE